MSAATVGPSLGPGPPGPVAPGVGVPPHHHVGAHAAAAAAAAAHAAQSHASSPVSADRGRKKSAHWTDEDTETLISVLLRHRETGRTADNGFKPEVWDEAAALLETNVIMGGQKTPDACKSRWQRLQRDYKFARQLLGSPYGFTWDNSNHRLQAPEAAWTAAEKEFHDARKHKKIHLPCYNQLSILCPSDAQIRQRPPKGRMPSSSSTMSESSAVVPLSLGPNSTPGVVGGTNGHGAPHGLQPSLSITESAHVWGDGDDSIDSVDASFTLPDGTRQTFAIPHQKRLPQYDASVLAATQPGHSPKRPRTNRQPQGTPTPTPHQAQQLYQLSTDQRTALPHQTPTTPQHPVHHTNYHTPQSQTQPQHHQQQAQQHPQHQQQHQQHQQQAQAQHQHQQQAQAQHQHQHQLHNPHQTPQAQSQSQPQQQQHQPHQQHQQQQAHQQHQQQHQQTQQHQQQHQQQQQQHQLVAQQHAMASRSHATVNTNAPYSTPYTAPTYTNRSPQYTPTVTDPSLPSPVYQPVAIMANGDMHTSVLRTPQQNGHTRVQRDMRLIEKPAAHAHESHRGLGAAASMPNLSTPTHAPNGGSMRDVAHGGTMGTASQADEGLALTGMTSVASSASVSPGVTMANLGNLPAMNNHASAAVHNSGGSTTGRSTPAPSSDVVGGLGEGARRTEAVLRLQGEDLSDADVLTMLHEFEDNIAAVDMYLALHKDRLRAQWLAEKIAARRR